MYRLVDGWMDGWMGWWKDGLVGVEYAGGIGMQYSMDMIVVAQIHNMTLICYSSEVPSE